MEVNTRSYLLDSNIYINFYERYYRFNIFPSFWNQFGFILNTQVIFPQVVLNEVSHHPKFKSWLKENYLNERVFLSYWIKSLTTTKKAIHL